MSAYSAFIGSIEQVINVATSGARADGF